jgi:hypothetical protein
MKKIFPFFLLVLFYSTAFGQFTKDTLHVSQLTHIDTVYKKFRCTFYVYNNKPFNGTTLDTFPHYELGISSKKMVPTVSLTIFKNGFPISITQRQNGIIIQSYEMDKNDPTCYTSREYKILNHLTCISRREKGKYLFSKTFDTQGRPVDIHYFNLDKENSKKKTISYDYLTGCITTIVWSKTGQETKYNCKKRRKQKTAKRAG